MKGDGVAGRPADEVGQEVAVVGEVVGTEAAIQVGGEVGSAPTRVAGVDGGGNLIEDQAAGMVVWLAGHDDFLGRHHGEGRE